MSYEVYLTETFQKSVKILKKKYRAGGQGQKGIRASLLLGAFCGNGGLEVGRKNEL